MPNTRETHEGPANIGMVRLAEKLVRRLGVKDALRMCRENSWDGVRELIQGRQNDGVHTV
ncbi:hypothetical protein ACFL12_08110 [Pseudomonadota bacterium]